MLYVNYSIDQLQVPFKSQSLLVRKIVRIKTDKQPQYIQPYMNDALEEMWNTYMLFIGLQE